MYALGTVKLTSSGTLYGHSVDTVASHFEEEEPLESLEELEAQTIGNLLPNDDDLLSGVTDGLDFMHPDKGDDGEELDFFSSVGGMDLEDDIVSAGQKRLEYPGGVYNGSVASEHPYGEHPSRTLFVRNINSNVDDSELRALFEVLFFFNPFFGDLIIFFSLFLFVTILCGYVSNFIV